MLCDVWVWSVQDIGVKGNRQYIARGWNGIGEGEIRQQKERSPKDGFVSSSSFFFCERKSLLSLYCKTDRVISFSTCVIRNIGGSSSHKSIVLLSYECLAKKRAKPLAFLGQYWNRIDDISWASWCHDSWIWRQNINVSITCIDDLQAISFNDNFLVLRELIFVDHSQFLGQSMLNVIRCRGEIFLGYCYLARPIWQCMLSCTSAAHHSLNKNICLKKKSNKNIWCTSSGIVESCRCCHRRWETQEFYCKKIADQTTIGTCVMHEGVRKQRRSRQNTTGSTEMCLFPRPDRSLHLHAVWLSSLFLGIFNVVLTLRCFAMVPRTGRFRSSPRIVKRIALVFTWIRARSTAPRRALCLSTRRTTAPWRWWLMKVTASIFIFPVCYQGWGGHDPCRVEHSHSPEGKGGNLMFQGV